MATEETHLTWDGDLTFTAEHAGFSTRIDGDLKQAPSPVALLVESVAACAAIDVVIILRRGRQEPTDLSVTTRYGRADEAPRYVKSLAFDFRLRGEVDDAKAKRAVALSFEKYCSVFHSLREDTELTWNLEVNGKPVG